MPVAFGSSIFARDHASKMMNARYLRISVIFVIVLALLSGVMLAKGKADKLFKDGQAAEAKEDWDKALELYLQAIDETAQRSQFDDRDAPRAF